MNPEIRVEIPQKLYFRIGDVAELIGVKPYVLRYWETEFPMVSPDKSGTGQRVYKRTDVETLAMIKRLLYGERYSIEGARKKLRELRREGELQDFRKETVATAGEESIPSEKLKQAQSLLRELRVLSQTPLSRLFSC